MAEPTDSGRVNLAIDGEREALLKVLVDHDVQFASSAAPASSRMAVATTLSTSISPRTVTRQTCIVSPMR